MRVLLTGGGTAGHINPALAIADIIRQNAPGSEIAFVGIRGGKEEDLVPREGYPLFYVKSKGFLRSRTPGAMIANLHAGWLALMSPYYPSTCGILNRFRPDIVIGTGGYACWPIMAAAARRGIPTALHESNALPGMAVRRLQGRTDRIWINFEKTAELLRAGEKVRCVGNPLRGEFGMIPRSEARRKLGLSDGQRLVLSFGGSLGAEHLNTAVLGMMEKLAPAHPEYLFCHASGKRDFEASRAAFAERGLDAYPNCVLTDYIYDMPLRMAAADLVISRAGAMTLSEIARMGLPSVLVPSPYVTDNHQYLNAKTLADAGAAVLVEEKDLPGGALAGTVEPLLRDRDGLRRMSVQVRAFAGEDTNRRIWEDILLLTGKRN